MYVIYVFNDKVNLWRQWTKHETYISTVKVANSLVKARRRVQVFRLGANKQTA